MYQRAPDEIQNELWDLTMEFQMAKESLSPERQQEIGKDFLFDAYNYVQAQTKDKTNYHNAVRTQAAFQHRQQEQLKADQRHLELHQNFIKSNFENADRYLKAIQFTGFASFFAIWSAVNQWLPEKWSILALLLMIFSAIIFVSLEIIKASVLTSIFHRHAGIALSGLQTFLLRRSEYFRQQDTAIFYLTRIRTYMALLCLALSVSASSILVFLIVSHYLTLFSNSPVDNASIFFCQHLSSSLS